MYLFPRLKVVYPTRILFDSQTLYRSRTMKESSGVECLGNAVHLLKEREGYIYDEVPNAL